MVILKWFRINLLKTNSGKFQFMILGKKQYYKVKLKINSIVINENDTVELLGITFDNILTFKEHINNLCRIIIYKIYALSMHYQDQTKLLYNIFTNGQFNYMPIIWMFC